METKYKDYLISDDKRKLKIDKITEMLNNSYWAENRAKDIIEKSIENSICIGVYDKDKQIGFARCVTDYATVYWLADVVIDPDYRRQGIGKALVEAAINHNELKGCFLAKYPENENNKRYVKQKNSVFIKVEITKISAWINGGREYIDFIKKTAYRIG